MFDEEYWAAVEKVRPGFRKLVDAIRQELPRITLHYAIALAHEWYGKHK